MEPNCYPVPDSNPAKDQLGTMDVTIGATGPQGPAGADGADGLDGAPGPPGVSGCEIVNFETPANIQPSKQLTVDCPQGKKALGPGWAVVDVTGAILEGRATHHNVLWNRARKPSIPMPRRWITRQGASYCLLLPRGRNSAQRQQVRPQQSPHFAPSSHRHRGCSESRRALQKRNNAASRSVCYAPSY